MSQATFNDVIYKPLKINQHNKGGYLIEGWRSDMEIGKGFWTPEMMYISMIPPGQIRGPHLHREQTDYFIFTLDGIFEIKLWESGKPDVHRTFCFGAPNPHLLIVPPGIVHAYKNVALINGYVINIPDRLYKGVNYEEIEDCIKYENNPEPLYKF